MNALEQSQHPQYVDYLLFDSWRLILYKNGKVIPPEQLQYELLHYTRGLVNVVVKNHKVRRVASNEFLEYYESVAAEQRARHPQLTKQELLQRRQERKQRARLHEETQTRRMQALEATVAQLQQSLQRLEHRLNRLSDNIRSVLELQEENITALRNGHADALYGRDD